MAEEFKLLLESFYKMMLALFDPMTLIPILLIFLYFYFKVKKYKEESYHKVTNASYFDVRRDIGKYGEYLIYKNLENFEKDGARFLFNVYMPKKDDETTEIDVLMISQKGIFVFESKNYSGWIFGNDSKKYWYQTLPKGRGGSHKEKFYNPVFQNNNHIKYLKSLVGDQIPMYSIITFSDRCTLMNVKVQNPKVKVINRYEVYSLVSSIYNNCAEDFLSVTQIEEIYNTLYPYTQVDENLKKKHVENINNSLYDIKKFDTESSISDSDDTIGEEIKNEIIEINSDDMSNNEGKNEEAAKVEEDDIEVEEKSNISKRPVCPLCGAGLKVRKAKYGEHADEEFYGCSNYPKCKYIGKIEKKG